VASSKPEALPETESRNDLDRNANMPVVGSEACILADLGKTRDVYPYTPDYKPMQVQMVGTAVRYESPFDGKVYILVIRNALYVPCAINDLQSGTTVSDERDWNHCP
jgi:hypothetical protein